MNRSELSRRRFLGLSAIAIGGAGLRGAASSGAASGESVALVVSPDDRFAAAPPVRWAIGQLRDALTARGVTVREVEAVENVRANFRVVVAAQDGPHAAPYLKKTGVRPLLTHESLALVPLGRQRGAPGVIACAGGVRGLVYALLELAERVEHADYPIRVLATLASPQRRALQRRSRDRPAVRERRRGQALVQRSRLLARVLRHAGAPAHQPVPPELRVRLRHAPQRYGRLPALPVPVPRIRPGLRRQGREPA